MTTINIRSVKPAGGGDYATLAAWDLARRGNLVADDRIEIAEVYGGGDADGVSLSSAAWTVDATRYPIIRAAAGEGHAGIYDVAKARVGDGTGATQITSDLAYIDVYQMQIYPLSAAGGVDPIALSPAAAGITNIDRCILRGGRYLFSHTSGSGSVANLRNCSCYGHGNSSAAIYAVQTSTTNIYNSTVIAKGRNIYVGHATTVVTENNNYLLQVGGDVVYFNIFGGTLNKGANTATNNAEATTVALRNIPYDVTNFVNVTAGTEDHHLVLGSSLILAGATILSVTEDIDGDPRVAGFYDIGCDQLFMPPTLSRVDDYNHRAGDWNTLTFGASIMYKGGPTNITGYTRLSVQTQDYSSNEAEYPDSIPLDWVSRYCRVYYFLPSSHYWHWCPIMGDTTITRGSREDAIRFFSRVYNNDQDVLMDAPCLVPGITYPHSFVHPAETMDDEVMTFTNVVDPNECSVEFYWMPTFPIYSVRIDLELFRISAGANDYIKLTLLAPTDKFQREYNTDDAYGAHDPTFRLEKVVGGVSEQYLDIICYFAHNFQDGSGEFFQDPIKIKIVHYATDRLVFEMHKANFDSRKVGTADAVAFAQRAASIIYQGYGYFSEPTLSDLISTEIGRLIPVGRVGAIGRVTSTERDAVMAGERDTSFGQMIEATPGPLPYSEGAIIAWNPDPIPGMPEFVDDFDRPDGPLGTADWTSKDSGWAIVSGRASTSTFAISTWDGRPRHQDIILVAKVISNGTANRVGLIMRYEPNFRDPATGGPISSMISAQLRDSGPAAAELRIYRYWKGDVVQLTSQALAAYTQGAEYLLYFDSLGDTFTAKIYDTATMTLQATATTTDEFLKRPGIYGIYGNPAISTVTIDELIALPNFEAHLDV